MQKTLLSISFTKLCLHNYYYKTFEALKFLLSFCEVIVFANLFHINILSSLLCHLSSSELIDYHVKTFFPENSSAFSEQVLNRKTNTLKIISINRETETQLQQTATSKSSSSVLAFTGKISLFQRLQCKQRFRAYLLVLPLVEIVLPRVALVLCRVVLVLSRVSLVLSCVAGLPRVVTRLVF